MSASDVVALTKDSGFLEGNGIIILILFFLMFGGWGNWGNRNDSAVQGALTRAELYDGLNSQNTFSEFRSLQSDITNGFAGVQQSICASNANITQTLNNGFANNALALNNGFNGVQQSIADSRYAMQDCCCQIKNTIHSEGEQTRALIQQNTIQDLRDKVADKDRELLATGLTTTQVIQTNTLENFIREVLKSSSSGGTTTA